LTGTAMKEEYPFSGNMKKGWCILGWLCTMAVPALGQVTNAGRTEANQFCLEWAAVPSNAYCIFATPGLEMSSWSNIVPSGVVFSNSKGACVFPMDEERMFYYVVASDYLIVDLAAGPNAPDFPVRFTNAPPAGGWGDEYKTTKLVLRRIPAGTFMMGSPSNEVGRQLGELLVRPVTLTQPFYVGVYELTQRQWERVMGKWPSYFANITYRDSRPVEQVNYNAIRGANAGTNWPADHLVDDDSFMGCLRNKTHLAFDLPTHAQSEYACRAGTITALNSGFNLSYEDFDVRMSDVGRYYYNGGAELPSNGDTSKGSAKVGSYLPNAWGLYDMHGNVSEWCLDWYGDGTVADTDPKGATSGLYRVMRSGRMESSAKWCRSAVAFLTRPVSTSPTLGFRVSLPAGP
jgi:formylglycine-generating enzyme required for sulfatase activity